MTPKTALAATLLAAQALVAPSCSDERKQAVKNFMNPPMEVDIDQPDKGHVDVTTYHPHADLHITLADSSVAVKNSFTGHMAAPMPYNTLDGFTKNLVNTGVAQTIKTPYVEPKLIDLGKAIGDLFKPAAKAKAAATGLDR